MKFFALYRQGCTNCMKKDSEETSPIERSTPAEKQSFLFWLNAPHYSFNLIHDRCRSSTARVKRFCNTKAFDHII